MELLIYLGKSAGVLTLFYAVYFLFLQKDTLFTSKRQFLAVGSIASILLPLVEFQRIIYMETPQLAVQTSADFSPIVQANSVSQSVSLDFWQLFALIYLLGIGLLLIRFMQQFSSIFNLISNSNSEKIEGFHHIKIHKDIAPFSFFRYIVYNPELHSEEEMKMILKHEYVHSSQWHSLDILLAHLLVMIQWMNPISWLFKKVMEENLEFIADQETVQQIQSKREYQLALVKVSSTQNIPALTTNFYQSFIKKRIIMLNKSNTKKVNVWKLGLILPLLAVFLWSFNVKEVVEYTTPPQDEFEPIEYSLVYPEAESETSTASSRSNQSSQIQTTTASNKQMDVQNIRANTGDEVYILITKNTTDDELNIHQKNLKKEHNIDFEFSQITRNTNGELTGIAIKFKDNQGNNGNYHISEDGPISDFYFYLSENGNIGFGSNAMTDRHKAREDRDRERTEIHEERMHQRAAAHERRMADSEVRIIETDKRMAESEERMQRSMERIELSKIRAEDRSRAANNEYYRIERPHRSEAHSRGGSNEVIVIDETDGNEVVYVTRERDNRTRMLITKRTTDAELANFQTKLASSNITFTYKGVKRNSDGEITDIKIKLKNSNGSVSETNIKSDGKAISPIHLNIE